MTYQERQELNALSKQVFGTASRWKKIMDKGVSEPYSKDREVVIPGPSGFTTKVFTDKKDIVKHYSVTEVKKLMLDILADRNKNAEPASK